MAKKTGYVVRDDISFHERLNLMNALLLKKGIHKDWIDQYRYLLIGDCMEESKDIQAERLLTAVAYAIRKCYGFGAPKIARALTMFDHTLNEISDKKTCWELVMKELDDETGIVIRTAPETNRLIIEYRGWGKRRAEIETAEFRERHKEGGNVEAQS